MSDSKNDLAWNQIFDKFNILNELETTGIFHIKSAWINEFRESRLMTKFDHQSQRPKIFIHNNLSILPTSRGSYVIGKFNAYRKFETTEPNIYRIDPPHHIESLDFLNITSETSALNIAFVTKILERFTEEINLEPTVNGRMSSSSFSFTIRTIDNFEKTISIKNAQIEIDGGYETDKSLILVEAKNHLSEDFIIRQLYYPYRLWTNKVTKKIRTIFLSYSNGVFHLREYKFDDLNDYNSLSLIKEVRYKIQFIEMNLEMLQNLLKNEKITKEPDIPFPQANSFSRVINLCELLYERELSKSKITKNYDFVSRQADYYTNAGRYLNLIEKHHSNGSKKYRLTQLGKEIFSTSLDERQILLIKSIIRHGVFNESLKLYLENAEKPNTEDIVKIMMELNPEKRLKDSTYRRRASTILSWINWVIEQIHQNGSDG